MAWKPAIVLSQRVAIAWNSLIFEKKFSVWCRHFNIALSWLRLAFLLDFKGIATALPRASSLTTS